MKQVSKYRALWDTLLIEVDDPEQETKGKDGNPIILPKSAQTGKLTGVVRKTGPEVNELLKPGIRVMFSFMSGQEVILDEKKYICVQEREIIAILKD